MSPLVVNLNIFQSKLSKVKCQIFSIVDVPWPYHPGHIYIIRSDFLQLHLAYQRLIGTSCSRGGTAASGLVGQSKKFLKQRSGEKNFFRPS